MTISALAFEARAVAERGRRIRRARFTRRSFLPVAAACVVAAAVRERLSAALGSRVGLRLLEPALPTPSAWAAIFEAANVYRVRAAAGDAAIVLRRGDALALACAALGEPPADQPAPRDLSPIERAVVERAVAAIAGTLAAVCGPFEGDPQPERVDAPGDFACYFELALDLAAPARIGIALARDVRMEAAGALDAAVLGDVVLPVSVALSLGPVAAGAVARLEPGAFLPITGSGAFRGSLLISGRTLAYGICGARGGRYALAIERMG